VTHHLELALPGAGYLVRMLEGRIDTQGPVSELRKRGILQEIASQSKKDDEATTAEDTGANDAQGKDKKAARKFIEDEERAKGRVQWSIYMAYIRASCVHPFYMSFRF
jgi:uncharacterized protein (UPF0305 family)